MANGKWFDTEWFKPCLTCGKTQTTTRRQKMCFYCGEPAVFQRENMRTEFERQRRIESQW